MPTLAGRALKLPKPRWPDNGGALGLGFKLGSDFIWTIIGHVTAQYWLVTRSIHRTNRVSANAGMLAEARRALPWHHPEHGHQVRQGHLRRRVGQYRYIRIYVYTANTYIRRIQEVAYV